MDNKLITTFLIVSQNQPFCDIKLLIKKLATARLNQPINT